MDLIKFERNMGKLVKLVSAVVKDVRYLFVFLVFNVSLFALYYMALGYQMVDKPDIKTYNYWHYFIESWKIATKGSRTKIDSIWDESEFGDFH